MAHRVDSSVENWPVVLEDLPSPANSEGFSSASQNLSFNMSGPVLRILQVWWLSVALRAEREVANPKSASADAARLGSSLLLLRRLLTTSTTTTTTTTAAGAAAAATTTTTTTTATTTTTTTTSTTKYSTTTTVSLHFGLEPSVQSSRGTGTLPMAKLGDASLLERFQALSCNWDSGDGRGCSNSMEATWPIALCQSLG